MPMSERWRRRVGGNFEGTRRLGGFVCGWIEVARRDASNAHTGQPRGGAKGVTGGEVEPSGGRQIFTPAGVKGTPGGVKVTPGGMEKYNFGKFRVNFAHVFQKMEGFSFFGKIIFSSVFWSV